MWRSLEPGTPSPIKRLEVCRTLNESGVPCGVLMAPIIPFLTDSPHQLTATVKQIAETGATHVAPIVLHLRTGARVFLAPGKRSRQSGRRRETRATSRLLPATRTRRASRAR